jgi:hypothetical protein
MILHKDALSMLLRIVIDFIVSMLWLELIAVSCGFRAKNSFYHGCARHSEGACFTTNQKYCC